jgi:hypothetical protein
MLYRQPVGRMASLKESLEGRNRRRGRGVKKSKAIA